LPTPAARQPQQINPALQEFQNREAWFAGQRLALESALGEAPLVESLRILVNTATSAFQGDSKAAFYLTGPSGDTLHHIVGMSEAYAMDVDGFRVESDTVACGLAVHRGECIVVADVKTDERWKPWAWLAEKHGYRACWSFPVKTTAGRLVGTFAVYWPEPRHAVPSDLESAALITQTAGIIIARHHEAEQRRKAEQSLLEAQAKLETELRDSELLRQISVELASEDDEIALYRKVVEAAATIMHSDVCTVQIFHPDRGPAGELQMIASTGLNAEGIRYWEWVRGDSGCTCGEVLRTGQRAIAEDVESCSFMAGTQDREVLLGGGIRAGQSTPLRTRSGKLVGMISTHWGAPHTPSERELRMLDIIARPTADLIERKRTAETQRLLLNELNHRVKNTLAVVQAMATRTLARSGDPKEFSRSFGGRVQALAKIHDLLSEKSWQGADLADLVNAQTSPGSADENRVAASGPSVQLDPQMALHMSLILHELTTNATKYGALSIPTGRVTVEWKLEDALRINWTEQGGPMVEPTTSKGFGSALIAQSAKGQGGSAVMHTPAQGVIWEIVLPYAAGTAGAAVLVNKPLSTSTVAKEDLRDLRGHRILVVEDEPLIGIDMVATLEDAGAVVEGPVSSIAESCRLIEAVRFDAALVDANLFGHPVDEIAVALAKRNVPFAFATGYGRDGLPEGFREALILAKPAAPEDVVATIARLVSPGIAKQGERTKE
jgi:two-component sensor histidine kinase/CheY-like chemotaxis protein